MAAADPGLLVSQTPAWVDCLCASGRFEDASGLYELPTGRRLVVPMVRSARVPRLIVQASPPPAWGSGGVIAEGGVRAEDVDLVLSDIAAGPALRTTLRPNPLSTEAWARARRPGVVALPRSSHVLDLEGGFERVWKGRFTAVARTAVRKAERSGIEVERDTSGRLVPVFYELFLRSLGRWAEKQHEPAALALWRGRRRDPLRKLETIARCMGEACRVWVARVDGRPAASIIVLQGANASYIRGAMDKDLAGPTRANYLLHRLAIEEACDAGCRHYHMGESGSSASLAHFKTRFGARAHPYADYAIERLPLTALDRRVRGVAKALIGFRDDG